MTSLPPSEMSRWITASQADGRVVDIVASARERDALATRFGLESITRLEAEVTLERDGRYYLADGSLVADFVQACAVSGDDMAMHVEESLRMIFVPEAADMPEEIELDAEECDEIPFAGDRFDLGEAVAQSLALAIDPFATGPGADEVRERVGLQEPERENPFAALKNLRSD